MRKSNILHGGGASLLGVGLCMSCEQELRLETLHVIQPSSLSQALIFIHPEVEELASTVIGMARGEAERRLLHQYLPHTAHAQCVIVDFSCA